MSDYIGFKNDEEVLKYINNIFWSYEKTVTKRYEKNLLLGKMFEYWCAKTPNHPIISDDKGLKMPFTFWDMLEDYDAEENYEDSLFESTYLTNWSQCELMQCIFLDAREKSLDIQAAFSHAIKEYIIFMRSLC